MPTLTASRGSSRESVKRPPRRRSSTSSTAAAPDYALHAHGRLGRFRVRETFRSLKSFNHQVWAAGGIVSNGGTWMQRTAQDWLVLTQLTHKNATAVGIVMALQFGPHLLMLPLTGFAADHLDRRKLLIGTQAALAALAFGLGILTVAGLVKLWHVYAFAFLLGCVT